MRSPDSCSRCLFRIPRLADFVLADRPLADASNHQTQVTDSATGQAAPMKGTVWLKTADVPTDPLGLARA